MLPFFSHTISGTATTTVVAPVPRLILTMPFLQPVKERTNKGAFSNKIVHTFIFYFSYISLFYLSLSLFGFGWFFIRFFSISF